WRGTGGGHGGYGGASLNFSQGGLPYDSLYEPSLPGSAGGAGEIEGVRIGGNGGGAIRLVVTGTLTINGYLSANGAPATYAFAGGGAGGSLWVTVGTIAGNGIIQANGGNATADATGNGAGGRVAVYYGGTFPGSLTLQANHGDGGYNGEPGTTYRTNISVSPSFSTVDASPATVAADGLTAGTITVTVLNAEAEPMPNRAVSVGLASGTTVFVDGQMIIPLTMFADIGLTDASGVATATITSTTTGERVFFARSGLEVFQDQAAVTFVAGPVDPAASSISTQISQAPADGTSPVTVTVTLRDAFGNPVPGAQVVIGATGSAQVTQPFSLTDASGQTQGSVRDAVGENVVISASGNGILLDATRMVSFKYADLSLSQSGPGVSGIGLPVTYTITLHNLGILAAENVIITSTLPAEVTYITDTLSVPVSQNGSSLTWNLGTVLAGSSVTFQLVGKITLDAPSGSQIAHRVIASAESAEERLDNNEQTLFTTLVGSDLAVDISAPAAAGSGMPVTYTLSLRNLGLTPAQNTVLSATLPVEFVYAAHTAPVEVAVNGQDLAWSFGVLQPGVVVTFEILGSILETAIPGAQPTVSVEATTTTPQEENPTNNVDSAATTITGPDLYVQLSGPSEAGIGAWVTYTLSLQNIGTAIARSVVLTATLPVEIGAVTEDGPLPAERDGQSLIWRLGDLESGFASIITLHGQVAENAVPLTDVTTQAQASTTSREQNTANNAGSVATRLRAADLVINMAGPDSVRAIAGLPVTYTLSVQNAGPVAAAGVILSDTLPSDLIYTGDSAAVTPSQDGQRLSWPFGVLLPGESLSFELYAQVAAGAQSGHAVSNVASAFSSTSDENPADNQAQASTFLVGEVSAEKSSLSTSSGRVAADGNTWAVISVIARDASNQPIPGAHVTLYSSESASLVQPFEPTDGQGRATGAVAGWLIETVEITATVEDVLLDQFVRVTFSAADLIASQAVTAESNTGPSGSRVLPAAAITYTLYVHNQGMLVADNVVVSDTLPADVVYVAQSSPYSYLQNGNLITWTVGSLNAGETAKIQLFAHTEVSANGTLDNMVSAVASSVEDTLENNRAVSRLLVELPSPIIDVSPDQPVIDVAQGETAQALLTIYNRGAAVMTGIQITPPPYVPWASVEPESLLSLAPGASTTVTITVEAPIDQAPGYYRDRIYVSDASGNLTAAAASFHVMLPTRPLVFTVENDQGRRVNHATVQITRRELSVLVTEGVTETYHQINQTMTDFLGMATFYKGEVGMYDYVIYANHHQPFNGTLTIPSGSGVITTTARLTALPQLAISPPSSLLGIRLGETSSLTVTVSNVGAAPVTGLEIELPDTIPWLWIGMPEAVTELAPGASLEYTLYASPPLTTSVGIYQDYLRANANGGQSGYAALTVDVTSNSTRDVQIFVTDEAGEPITAPGTVVLTRVDPVPLQLPGGEIVPYRPQYSQPINADGSALFGGLEPGDYIGDANIEGFKSDPVSLPVSPGSEPQRANLAMQDSHLQYSWNVRKIGPEYEITLYLVYEYIEHVPDIPGWLCEWIDIYGTCHPAVWGTGLFIPDFLFPPIYLEYGVEVELLKLSQTVTLEGEDFLASMDLSNTGDDAIENVSVQLEIVDENGADSSDSFTVYIADQLASTIRPKAGSHAEWLLVPKGLNLTSSKNFGVSAVIHYTRNGQQYTTETPASQITVDPAPNLAIHYEMSAPGYYCTVFILKAIIENHGDGWARDLRISTSLPQVIASTGRPVNFTILSAKIDGETQPDSMNLVIGNVGPGSQAVVEWELKAGKPGRFIGFYATFRQKNYMGLPMTPLISEVTAELVNSACKGVPLPGINPFPPKTDGNGDKTGGGDNRGCPVSSCNNGDGGVGDPINASSGSLSYGLVDLSIPTVGGPIAFQRTYESAAIEAYTTTLGYGWTHNQDTRLIFPESRAPSVSTEGLANTVENQLELFEAHSSSQLIFTEGLVDPDEVRLVLFKAHSSSQLIFTENEDGTFTPYPGVLAMLVFTGIPTNTYRLTASDQSVYTFDQTGRLLTWIDAQGHGFHYTYTGAGLLSRVSDDTGQRYLQLSYDTSGRITSVADHTGRSVSFGYDPATGDLVTFIDVLGKTWTYSYDGQHHLTQVIDPRGIASLRTEYDSEGRAVRQFDGLGNRMVEIAYQIDGTRVITDSLGNTEVYTYDSRNTLTSECSGEGIESSKGYDSNFRPATIGDPLGNVTTLNWSPSGANLNSVTDALGNPTVMTYDDLNNLTAVVDPLGNSSTYTYSGTLLTASTDALGASTHYIYTTAADAPQPVGLLKTVTDPLGRTTRYLYDLFGQLISVTDAQDRTTTYRYDGLGRMVAVTGPQGRSNWTCYDNAGRVIRTVSNASGDGSSPQTNPCDAANYVPSVEPGYDLVSRTIYDAVGNVIAGIDALGRISRTYYDDANRPVATTRNLTGWAIDNDQPPPVSLRTLTENLTTRTVYDDNGNVIATLGLDGRVTRSYYDELNRPYFTLQNLVVRGIDGNPLSTEDAIEQETPPEYNPLYPDENAGSETMYDAAGNVIATTGPDGMISRTYYDALNRAVTSVQNLVGQEIDVDMPPARDPAHSDRNLRTDTVYDAGGNVVATIDPAGRVTRTYYDELGRGYLSVQNLVARDANGNPLPAGQAIDLSIPPAYNPAFPDENLRSETIYDRNGQMLASTGPDGRVSRTYYDTLGRAYLSVQNLVVRDTNGNPLPANQAIDLSAPPAYDPAHPDENL
ncbi:MAG: DUF11 domain-containing protein, partial [Chloroflexota bacterium]